MAITSADYIEYDIPAQAEAMKIPPAVLKVIIRKTFNMAPFGLIPDKINFIPSAKAYPPITEADGSVLAVNYPQRLLLNGENSLAIGLYKDEGTTVPTIQAFIVKVAPSVFDLSPWKV